MPKINVYLPDELADAVREAGVPVSAVCQRALEQAVRRITAIRQSTLDGLGPEELAERLPLFTVRARAVVGLAIDRAEEAAAPAVGTGHLLAGLVAEGDNLALRVLGAIEVDRAAVQRDLARRTAAEPAGSATSGESAGSAGSAAPGGVGSRRFSGPAANVLELTVTEATALGHNYVGCEHLLLGMLAEPDGVAGQVLRALGAEPRSTRRAVSAALAGYVHLRAQAGAVPAAGPLEAVASAVHQQIEPLVARVERLERRLGPAGEDR